MSNKQLFVFVEGDEDPFFYGTLCSSVLSETGISYRIYTPREIPESRYGKKALIDLYKYIDSTSSLLNELGGKKTGIIFFLDKDLDDLMDIQIHSEYVVYTYFYDIENHIIEHGDLIKGCASAAAMDPQEVATYFGNQIDWLRTAAQKWKDWVKVCVFAKVKLLENCPVNYGRPSQINEQLIGIVDKTTYESCITALKSVSGLSDTEFASEYDRISKLVDDLYAKSEHGKVFKGKWYKHFLDEQIRQLVKTTYGKIDGFERQIFKHIASTLDFNAGWTEYFSQPLRKVIEKLNDKSKCIINE